MFGHKPKEKLLIVEVEKPREIPDLNDESRDAVLSLQHHPGFQYLLARLKVQRHALQARLQKDRHSTMKDVEFLQSGVFWTDWLQAQISREVFKTSGPRTADPVPSEQELIERVLGQLDIVGREG